MIPLHDFFMRLYNASHQCALDDAVRKSLLGIMRVTSPSFCSGEMIPAKYTCDGKDVNPELLFEDVPGDTQSIAILVDDPSSPSGNWLHWSVWNISPTTRMIRENSVPQGAREGETDFSEIGYGGPCPGVGEHEYRFTAYALDCILDIGHGAPRNVIEEAMEGHVLAQGALHARYQRQKIRAALQQHAMA